MPALTNGSATTAVTTTTKTPLKRFELPALEFKFSSLTEGTDIPPPLPSPIAEEPPETKAEEKKSTPVEALTSSNGASTSSKTNGTQPSTANTLPSPSRSLARGGLKRSAEDVPASPTLSSRPGSIRRLFSRNLLNSAYANAEAEGQQANPSSAAVAHGIVRPDSRSDGSFMDERRSKRSSGWFRRLRGSGTGASTISSNGSVNGDSPTSKRTSIMFEEVKKPLGPPPPMIPELGELEAKVDLNDEGSLGSDLFKNIK